MKDALNMKIQRALLSVSDKTGPEILDGRVKTLHPKIHGGILQRRDHPDDRATCQQLGLPPIDLVCVNLYPFEAEPSIENIDIGGPAMIRSAAKNHADVIVLCEPADYASVLVALQTNGDIPLEQRRLAGQTATEIALRYGENPHQQAILRPDATPPPEANLTTARILHGKAMSFNNYVDGDAALEAARELHAAPAAVIIKAEALAEAWEGDVVSAFGSVIAVTRPVDAAAAQVLKGRFVEALIAPSFEPDALEFLQNKSKNIRLLSLDCPLSAPLARKVIRQINGATLIQDADVNAPEEWRVVTRAILPDDLRPTAEFGIRVGKHLKSNAIVLAWEYAPGQFAILGMGAGQPNRVDALRKLALEKARENITRRGLDMAAVLARTVLVSDAFFPFADNIEAAAEFGIRYIVEPGGSKQDAACIAACDQHGIAMVFSGCRHFRH